MEEFEVCTFCGEVFKGEDIRKYKGHYEGCRDNYEQIEDKDDKYGNFYSYGDN